MRVCLYGSHDLVRGFFISSLSHIFTQLFVLILFFDFLSLIRCSLRSRLVYVFFPPFNKVFAPLTAGLSSAALLCRLSLYVRGLVCVVNCGAFPLKVEKTSDPHRCEPLKKSTIVLCINKSIVLCYDIKNLPMSDFFCTFSG